MGNSVGLDVVKSAAREWVEMDLQGDPESDADIHQMVRLIRAASSLDEVIQALNHGVYDQLDDGEIAYNLLSMIVDD